MAKIYRNIFLPQSMKNAEVKRLFSALSQEEGEHRFVGGCVRDTLFGHTPRDLDIATTHPPEKVMELLQKADIHVVATGLAHGTVTAVINHHPFEITTLRKDIECHGRHATVEFTTDFKEDALRRDFTFNAMSCDEEGRLYDYFNGEADLKKGIVRFVGDASQRIEEDYLRILRFFRFFVRYGKEPIEISALRAIERHAEKLTSLSGERIQHEMFRLLASLHNTGILELMHDVYVLQHITLPCTDFQPIEQLIMLEESYPPSISQPLARLASLLRSNAAKETCTKELIQRWKLSNHDSALLKQLVTRSDILLNPLSLPEQKRYLRQWGRECFMQTTLIAWSEWLCRHDSPPENLNSRYAAMLKLADEWQIPDFPVSGKDIIALGISPGKQIGAALKQAEEWWENNDYPTEKEEIMQHIKEILNH